MNKVVEEKFIPQQLLYFIIGQRCCQRLACTFRRTELEIIVNYAHSFGLRIIYINGLQECVKVFKEKCKHYIDDPTILRLCYPTITKMSRFLSDTTLVQNVKQQITSEQSGCQLYIKELSLNMQIKPLDLLTLPKKLEKPLITSFNTAMLSMNNELLKTIYAHRVTVFQANLSTDKSLLIPNIILNDYENINCNLKIVCIEKENIIAMYNSERLANMLGENVGKTVGLQVSQKNCISSETLVVYTTSKYFLRSLFNQNAYNLHHISHIIVSDVSLHAPYTDILLFELKKLLIVNPNLRLILLAQNYDSHRIFAYFGEGAEFCLEQTCQYVSHISYIEDIQNYIDLLSIQKDSETYKKKPQRLHRNRNEQIDECLQAYEELGNDVAFRPLLYSISCEMLPVNYQHSITGKTAAFIASQLGNVNHLRLLLFMGANPHIIDNQHENAITIANLKNNIECMNILKNHSVHDYPSKHVMSEIVDYNLLIDIMYMLFSNTNFSTGNILIILPSYFHVVKLNFMLLTHFLTDNLGDLEIFLLYEDMELEYLNSLLSSGPGKVKIVLTTDIIESLPLAVSFKYLIDTVRKRTAFYDAFSCSSECRFEWLSKDSLLRRQLLLNSTDKNMECFRLVSKATFNSLNNTSSPELQTMQLDKICLYAKLLSPDTSISEYLMNTIFPPISVNVHQTVQFLKKIDVLDDLENITWLGCRLIDIPIACQFGRTLIFGIFLQCLDPILTIVCALSTTDPLHCIINEDIDLWSEYIVRLQKSIKREHASLVENDFSDHLIFLQVFREWHDRFKKNASPLFLTDEFDFVLNGLMEQLTNTRSKIISSLRAANLINRQEPFNIQNANIMSDNWPIVKAALVGGMYPNICFVGNDRNGFKSPYSGNMYLHPKTVIRDFLESPNISAQKICPQWIVCNIERNNIKYATVVAPLAVALFCGSINLKLENLANIQGASDNMDVNFFIDEWIWMSTQKSTMVLVMRLRQHLFKMFHNFLMYCGKPGKFRSNSTILKQYRLLLEALNEICKLEDATINLKSDLNIGFRPSLKLPNSFLHSINIHFMCHQTYDKDTVHNEHNFQIVRSIVEKHYFLLYTDKYCSQFYENCDKSYIEDVIGKFIRPILSPSRHIYVILYSKNPDILLSISRALIQSGEIIFKEYFRNEIPINEIRNSCASFKMNMPHFDCRLTSSIIDKRVGKLIMDIFAFRHHCIHK